METPCEFKEGGRCELADQECRERAEDCEALCRFWETVYENSRG